MRKKQESGLVVLPTLVINTLVASNDSWMAVTL